MLDAGHVLVVGGYNDSGQLDTTEVLDIGAMTFASGPKMGVCRRGCAAVTLDGRILVIGGYNGQQQLETTEVLDTTTMKFSPGPRTAVRYDGCTVAAIDS